MHMAIKFMNKMGFCNLEEMRVHRRDGWWENQQCVRQEFFKGWSCIFWDIRNFLVSVCLRVKKKTICEGSLYV